MGWGLQDGKWRLKDGKWMLGCCCDADCPHVGTVLEDASCGPYEGFSLFATPFGGGAPVTFYGGEAEWALIHCKCPETGFLAINGTVYSVDLLSHAAHWPFKIGMDCQHLDPTGMTLVTSVDCVK